MRIGFELETLCTEQPENGIGEYHDGADCDDLSHIGGRCMNAQSDSSLCPTDGEMGIEFVSPTFALNKDNIHQMEKVVDEIQCYFGARTNRSCGTHISVSLPALDHRQYRTLNYHARLFQQGMFASTGSITRQSGSYARPMLRIPYTGDTGLDEGNYETEDRTNWLNLRNVNKHARTTERNARCEYRLFSGTTDAKKLIAWSQLATCFTEWAIDMEGKQPTVPNKKPLGIGEGRYTLDCMLDTLGWLDDSNTNWVDNDVMTVKEAVKLLQTLADKYDAKMYGERKGTVL